MIGIVSSLVVFLHGLIHLLEFVKGWNLAQVKQLRGATLVALSGSLAKIVGILWLIAGLLFHSFLSYISLEKGVVVDDCNRCDSYFSDPDFHLLERCKIRNCCERHRTFSCHPFIRSIEF